MILQKDPDSKVILSIAIIFFNKHIIKGLEEITDVELFNLLKNNEAVAVLIGKNNIKTPMKKVR